MERRVFRIIGDDAKDFVRLAEAAENVCQRLFSEVVQNMHHPLRSLFVNRVPTTRDRSVLKPPFARTVRFKNSFIRFGS